MLRRHMSAPKSEAIAFPFNSKTFSVRVELHCRQLFEWKSPCYCPGGADWSVNMSVFFVKGHVFVLQPACHSDSISFSGFAGRRDKQSNLRGGLKRNCAGGRDGPAQVLTLKAGSDCQRRPVD